MATLGERIRILREEKGLGQADLGRVFDLGKSTISNYETETTRPSPEMLRKFADFFGVSTGYLLGRTDVRTPAAGRADDELDRAIVALRGRLSPEDREEILKFIEWVKERRRREKPKS